MVASILNAGAVALVSYEADASAGGSPDALRFVLLAPVGADTTIYISNRTWNGSSFAAAGGGDDTYAWTADIDLPAGTIVTLSASTLSAAGVTLSNGGETLYFYQGAVEAPSRFLFAADVADGNTVFDGTLANTGLTTAQSAVAIAVDNAVYQGSATGNAVTQLASIADNANWYGSDQDDIAGTTGYTEVIDTTVSTPLAPHDMVLLATMAGGGQSEAILRLGRDDGSTTAASLASLLRDQFPGGPRDVAFDLDNGYFFVVDADGNNLNRIVRGNIADLVNGTPAPTLTEIFATNSLDDGPNQSGATVGEIIVGLEVDRAANKIYWADGNLFGEFEGGFQLWEANYDGSDARLIQTIDEENLDPGFGFPGGVSDVAVAGGFMYVAASSSSIDGLGNADVLQNHILKVDIATGAVQWLDLGAGAADGYHDGRLDPAQGQIIGIDVDTATGDVWFVTQPISPSATAGIFRFAQGEPAGDPVGGTLTRIWEQPANDAFDTLQLFPTSNMTHIEIDEIGGRYYVNSLSDTDTEDDATPGTNEADAAIFSGSLTAAAGTAPTLFQRVYEPTANGAPGGMEIDYAAKLAVTSANASYTESSLANSPAGAPVTLFTGAAITDPDNAILYGAQVAISANFLSGDILSFTASGGIVGSYSATTGLLTLSGMATVAQYQTVLNSVGFANAGDNPTAFGTNTTRTITMNLFDGLTWGDATSVSVTVVGVNDAPVNVVPGTQAVDEEATLTFSAGNGNQLRVGDVDSPGTSYQVTLGVAHGTLTLSGTGGLAFATGDGTADATMSFTGSEAAVNAALDGLTYTPAANYNGADGLTITVDDQGSTGIDPGGPNPANEQDSDTVTIEVAPVNDTPVVALAATLAAVEQVAATIDPTATITDADLAARNGGNGDYAGAVLRVTNDGGDDANDLFAVGAGGPFTISGTNLQAGGLTFATVSGGNGSPLVISFTSSGTPATSALVNAVAQSVQYTYSGDTPPVAGIDIAMSLDDGAPGNAGQGSVASNPAVGEDVIQVSIEDTPENTAPVVDLNGADAGTAFATTYNEDGPAAAIADSDVSITDVDAGDPITGATIVIGDAAAGDQLTVAGVLPGTIVALGSGTATLTLTGSGTRAEYEQALATIRYSTTSDDPTALDTDLTRTVNVTVTDGTAESAVASTTITLTAANDPAGLDLNGAEAGTGSTLAFTEDGPLSPIAPAATIVDDATDFDTATLTVSFATPVDTNDLLRIVEGAFTVEEGGRLLFGATEIGTAVGGNGGSGELVITFNAAATPTIVRDLIRSIGFVNFSFDPVGGDRTLVFSFVDGDGAASTPVQAIVTVTPVENAAVAQDDALVASEDIPLEGSIFTDNGFGEDVDPDGPAFQVTEVNGNAADVGQTVTLASGATFRINADGTLTFDANGRYENLPFGESATETFSYTITGGDTATVTITVAGENDAATIAPVGVQDTTVTEAGGVANATPGDPSASGTLAATDPDQGESAFQPQLALDGTYGAFTLDATTGAWTYALDDSRSATQSLQAGEVAQDTLTIRSADNTPYTITVTVTGANDAPEASATAPEPAVEQQPLDLKGTLSVADIDAGTGTITATLSVGYGTISATAGGSGASVTGNGTASVTLTGTLAQINALLDSDATSTLSYLATTDQPPASATLTLMASDGALSDSVDQTITITPVNDAPSGADKQVMASPSAPHVFTAADFGFSDVDGNALAAVIITTAPVGGTLYIDSNGPGAPYGVAVVSGQEIDIATINAGQLVLVPDAGAPNTTFTFQVRDDGGTALDGQDTDPTANTISTNRPPLANDDAVAATEDVPATYTAAQLLANDSDADADTLAIVSVSNATNGTVVLNGNGTVTFTGAPEFSGPAGFDYTLSDGRGGTDVAHVTVAVSPVNDPPVAPAVRSVSIDEDTASPPIFIGGSDVDGDPLSYAIKPGAAPAKGSVSFVSGFFVYTPAANANGTDSFVILVGDGQSVTEQIVDVTIKPVNDAPQAVDDLRAAIIDTTASYSVAGLLGNDTDVDGDTLLLVGMANASNGTVTRSGSTITFTPAAGFLGTAGFDYTVSDGKGGIDLAHVTVAVGETNSPPVVDPEQDLTTRPATAIVLSVAASDPNDDPLTYAASAAAHGTVIAGPNGTFVYTPVAGFLGSDSFTVTVSDGRGGSAVQVVQIEVADAPAAQSWRLFAGDGFAGAVGGSGTVFGTNEDQEITVLDRAGSLTFDPSFNRGGDVIRLAGDADAWQVTRSGSSVILTDGDTSILVPIGGVGAGIAFDDGTRVLAVDGVIRIGSQIVTENFATVTAPPGFFAEPDIDTDALGRLFLTGEQRVVAGGDLTVFGTTGMNEIELVSGSIMLDPSFNKGGDTVALDFAADTVSAILLGSNVRLSAIDLQIDIPVGLATTIAFADGDRTLLYDQDSQAVLIGEQEIGSTSAFLTFA